MRLQEVERGDRFSTRLLFNFISLVSGMRLPDAARIVMYHKDFYGHPITSWTHAAMRGESTWSVGERELMAAMTAKWNSSAFCMSVHGAIASLVFEKSIVKAALDDFQQAPLSDKVKAALVFLERLTRQPDQVSREDARLALKSGVSPPEMEDAMAVVALFSITVRCADAFEFAMLSEKDAERGAKRMLVQGYAWGKGKTPNRPDHRALAKALRRRVLEGPGVTEALLRQKMARRASGGPAIEPPYDELAFQMGEAADKVTDEQVIKVAKVAGSEKAAFELMVSAAVGAGLYRWQKGLEVLGEGVSEGE
jgi:alkylhydroperoxidase family enzyme